MLSATLKFTVVTAITAFLALPTPAMAGKQVPFRGNWMGHTVSAQPSAADPNIIVTVAAGNGTATHLGEFYMVSPHLSHILTGAVEGLQIFEATNGDLVIGIFTGQFVPTSGGFLDGVLHATIIGGTGRFRGVSGSYTFHILFDFATFTSLADFDGTISSPGKGN